MSDTIVALATPLGRSGIGVIRLSGPRSLSIAEHLTGEAVFRHRRAHYVQLIDPGTTQTIDEALVTFFKAPHSFTGEDVIEISCHGSPIVLRQVIDRCLQLNARLAEPGEFTLRALANGRIDLTEAEAIRDLIEARTTASAQQALKQLKGEFSHELQPLKDDLLSIVVVLESALEFVEDDLPQMQIEGIRNRLISVKAELERIADTFEAGHLIRDGLRVAIVGRPNVGKSSLFNTLLGIDRAIVTEIAGTTRDQLYESLTIENIPISLVDTAGLRETSDTVEKIGVERAKRSMADADIVLVVFDISEDFTSEDRKILTSVSGLNHFIVANKIDKVPADDIPRRIAAISSQQGPAAVVRVSAKTGAGLDELKRAMIEPFEPGRATTAGFLVSDARHRDLLIRAVDEICESLRSIDAKASEEITLIGLHNAMRYLGEITGETTTEDMLTRIFATFCIGK
jgi:tRNA modification GTPase